MARFTYLALVLALVSASIAAPAPVDADEPASEALEVRASGTRTGRGTFFNVGLGACGKHNKNSDHIVAISEKIFAGGKLCEKTVEITNKKTGKKQSALVRDECPECAAGDLDMSPSLFTSLGATLDQGVIQISWELQ